MAQLQLALLREGYHHHQDKMYGLACSLLGTSSLASPQEPHCPLHRPTGLRAAWRPPGGAGDVPATPSWEGLEVSLRRGALGRPPQAHGEALWIPTL